MQQGRGARTKAALKAYWPWLVLAGVAAIAVWPFTSFWEAPDSDFPGVIKPFFSERPPGAYRLTEPGDTLDRIALYFATGALVLSASGVIHRLLRRRGEDGSHRDLALWPAATSASLALFWHAATPGPTFDGWHGLGYRTMFDTAAPAAVRVGIAAFTLTLIGIAAGNAWRNRGRWRELAEAGKDRGALGLLAAAVVLIALRQGEIPGVEPAGYWPRCALDLGVLAFGLALIRLRPLDVLMPRRRVASGMVAGWTLLVLLGICVVLLHRPLSRLRAIVPGKIYMSAMPTYTGLGIAHDRLRFRTIINLFDETSPQRSPRHEDELRFVRENGIHYLGSPADGMESDRFLDETLRLAQDPSAWPILVHCHGCMDRTPAWMGMYRFLIEKRPLAEIYQEIERHRGSRPKAIVMFQYRRKLAPRDPERYAADPTAQDFSRWVNGTPDPYDGPDWRGRKAEARISARTKGRPEAVRP